MAPTKMLPPSGEQYRIESAGYAAVITESGGALRTLTHDGHDVIDGFDEAGTSSSGRGQLLMPWPNRIRDGRYTHARRPQQLALTEPALGNASHGLVRWAAWSLLAQRPDHVALCYRLMAQTGYPWTLDLRVEYAVGPDGLTVTQSATNRATETAPYASGAHPYLALDTGPVDDWTLTVPAAAALTSDERKLPLEEIPVAGSELDFRSPRPIGATVLDTCFGRLGRDDDGLARVTVAGPERSLQLWVDDQHDWLMLYTGEGSATARRSLAVEPMTAPPDAFNSHTGLALLAPGETRAASWGIRVGR